MILTNQIDRASALKILEKPAMSEAESKNQISYICKKLRISIQELNSYEKMEIKSFRDYKNQYLIYKLGAMVMRLLREDVSGKKR